MISNIPGNRYPETRIRTKTLDIILKNWYRKTGIITKILDIILEHESSQVSFGYYFRIFFGIFFRYCSVLPFDLF